MNAPFASTTNERQSAGGGLLGRYATMLGAEMSGSGLTVHVDERYRLRLRSLPDGRIQVRARLRALPEPGRARDAALLHAGRLSCGRMNASPAACVVDADEHALWLQQVAASSSTQEIDELVGEFCNELAFWTQAVPNE